MALAGAIKVATSGSAAFALSQESALSTKGAQCQQPRAVCMGAKPATANLLSSSIAGEIAALSATRPVGPARRTRRDICRAVAAQDVKSAESATATGDKVGCSLEEVCSGWTLGNEGRMTYESLHLLCFLVLGAC